MMRLVIISFIFFSYAFGQIHDGLRVYGGLSSSSGSTANTSGTPVKVSGTYNLSGLEKSFDEPVEGRLRYTGESTLDFKFGINFSFTSDTNNHNISLFAGKNGTVIIATEIETRIGTGSDVGQVSIGYFGTLAENDFFEAFLDTGSGNPTITTQHLTMTADSLN